MGIMERLLFWQVMFAERAARCATSNRVLILLQAPRIAPDRSNRSVYPRGCSAEARQLIIDKLCRNSLVEHTAERLFPAVSLC
jgi:hypothetical protein